MTTDSQYSWPRFFMELADKLLAFKDDRQALIAMLQHVYADIGMALPTLDSGGIPTDIDPFTVYGLFNRGLTDNKRRAVALGIGGALGVQAPLHDDFVGVPVLLNINATFYDQVRRDDGLSKGYGTCLRLRWLTRISRLNRQKQCSVMPTIQSFNSAMPVGTSRWDSSGSARTPTST